MKGSWPFETTVLSRDSADFFRLIFPRDSADNLFLVNDFYKDGKPKMVGKTIYDDPIVKLQGVNVTFFHNGQKSSERNFENGTLLGDVIEYFPNGEIYLMGSYNKDGKLVINECRDSTGKVSAFDGNGHCINTIKISVR